MRLKIQINGIEIKGLVDTQAEGTMISPNLGLQNGFFRRLVLSF